MTHQMKVLNSSGHSTLEWNPTDERTTEEVKAEFDRLVVEGGLLAYVTTEPGKGEQIKEFDPEAKEILVTPRLVGG